TWCLEWRQSGSENPEMLIGTGDGLPGPDLPRPWTRPGASRRDLPPHRAELLGRLVNASLACGVAAFVLGAPALPGLALGLTASLLANSDLRRMGRGAVDPRGRAATRAAR